MKMSRPGLEGVLTKTIILRHTNRETILQKIILHRNKQRLGD
jgi:hypothetical protein